jgi:N-acetylglucosaminyl-diphospho-decaprenol L-rhamnosyltransferase
VRSVSVIIPTLRGGALLDELVSTLMAPGQREVEVLIADNGLSPEAVGRLRDRGARLVPMGANLGVATAINHAASVATGSVLAALNDDISVESGFLDALLEPLDLGMHASAGVLLQDENPEVIETAGIVIDRFLGSYDHLQGERVEVLAAGPPAPLGPCGGAGAWTKEAFEALGGFDERFFAYCEDVDLAVRMSRAGIGCALATGARARHAGSGTLGYHSLAKACRVGESRGALIAKYGLLRRPASAAWVLGSELTACLELARRHRSLAPARARVNGYRSGRRRGAEPDVRPLPSAANVTLVDGLRRRYRRSLRSAAT